MNFSIYTLRWFLLFCSLGIGSIASSSRHQRSTFTQQVEEGVDLRNEAVDRDNGQVCKFNYHCASGCCLAPLRENRYCSPLSQIGKHCEEGQIKGGFYADFCPCIANAICGGRVNATHHKVCK